MGIDITGIGAVAGFAESVWTTIFGKKPTPEESMKFERMVNDRDAARDESKKEVMVAELNQGDLYTKRARPTVVYFGLLVILVNHVLNPWTAYFISMFMADAPGLPNIQLPGEFWIAWGGICSVWCIGRSAEKIKASGTLGKIANLITGR